MVFIITGVLDSLERDEAAAIIVRYGGKVVKAATSKSLTHILLGDDAGPKKLEVAMERKLPMLSEDEFFHLISTEPAKKLSAKEKTKIEKMAIPKSQQVKAAQVSKAVALPPGVVSTQAQPGAVPVQPSSSTSLWTTLYHPNRSSDLVGNPTSIKKLKEWLSAWTMDTKKERAALLSGPPGVGKTSSAAIIAKELGYELIEFNASDTRSKKAIEVSHLSLYLSGKSHLCSRTMFQSS
jgi:replication factor C subunit 1